MEDLDFEVIVGFGYYTSNENRNKEIEEQNNNEMQIYSTFFYLQKIFTMLLSLYKLNGGEILVKVNFKIFLNFLNELKEDLLNYDGIKRCDISITSVENFCKIENSENFYFESINFTYNEIIKDITLDIVGKRNIVKLKGLYFYFNNIESLEIKQNEFTIILKNGSGFSFKYTKLPKGV